MKNHGFNDNSQWEESPKSVEDDDVKMDALMYLQDPDGILERESKPETMEEKYEGKIIMEKVIEPMLRDMFKKK